MRQFLDAEKEALVAVAVGDVFPGHQPDDLLVLLVAVLARLHPHLPHLLLLRRTSGTVGRGRGKR